MQTKTAIFLARTSIKRWNKGTLAMTILIMTLAYINLVFTPSIFGWIINAINIEAIDNQYSNILIEPETDEKYIENKEALSLLTTVPWVVWVSQHYLDNVSVRYDRFDNGQDVKEWKWMIKSINPEDEKNVTRIHQSMIEGTFLDQKDKYEVIIWNEIAGGLGGSLEHLSLGGISVWDEIDLQFSNRIKRSYKVKGIFKTKSTQVNQMIFVTEKEMESVLSVHNRASEVLVKIKNIWDEESYIKKIRDLWLYQEDIKKRNTLMGWTASASDSFKMVSMILGAIGTMIAGVTIFIIIFVSVVNKKRQIWILKAIWMKKSTIVLSFVLQAIFFGIVWIVFWAIFILFVLRPFFLNNPLDFPMGRVSLWITFDIIKISNLSLIIASFIGGFIPAYRGAKESILESIRG